ncbi:cytochrome o ubiquinol oxidase subunit IV [Oxalicibacterium faecigallinarum]|uniref:Cytochrome bo(3) ubiquinol oxidase subunit 4 n=1 Tax=Oxalicibacterium faecigallinarum TaxID=573741 RepID=A0A8J3B032_9BURK|nr:cytochrome o ubiquinol oxidase subunit IV [Oxalicibacterium faecigallinarum]GGI20738.1 cytochrome o ubiquinol oxidase subunit IV [Oxalicibacterium faecigallinarum]
MSDHAHAHGDHGHDDHDSGYHATTKGYVVGFILSVILTAIPFWLVMGNVIQNSNTTAFVILGFAAVQIVVHMVYFLHMNGKVEGGWSMLALIFTVVVVIIMLAGSIWVMYHLNHNMMPGMMHDAAHNLTLPAGAPDAGHLSHSK